MRIHIPIVWNLEPLFRTYFTFFRSRNVLGWARAIVISFAKLIDEMCQSTHTQTKEKMYTTYNWLNGWVRCAGDVDDYTDDSGWQAPSLMNTTYSSTPSGPANQPINLSNEQMIKRVYRFNRSRIYIIYYWRLRFSTLTLKIYRRKSSAFCLHFGRTNPVNCIQTWTLFELLSPTNSKQILSFNMVFF